MTLPDPFQRYREELEAELISAIGKDPSPFYGIMRYHMGWVDELDNPRKASGGKHLRPTLCLLACETVGADWHKALPGAAAVEVVHNFTLIHDDVQDKSRHRRHRPTVWNLWGIAQAINAGDGMWAAAQLAVLRLQDRQVPPHRVLRASQLLSEACLILCEGQYLDVSFETRPDIEIPEYLQMIDAKTAQLFSCAISIGAVVGTEDDELISQLGIFGRKLGMAFQIHDDLLGIWADQKATGKSAHTDIKEKKKTLPVILAQQHAKGAERERLSSLYQSKKARLTSSEVAEVVDILNHIGAKGFAEEYKHQYRDQALEVLDHMKLPSHQAEELREMTDYVLSQS